MTANESETGLEERHMRWVWGGAFAVAALFGYGLTPWDAIQVRMGLVEGVDWQSLLAFAAGYTLPATLGFAIIVWLAYSGVMHDQNGPTKAVVYSLILVVTAVLCQNLGLGLLPDFAEATYRSGPPYVMFPVFVLSAYVNSYGLGLMFTAAAIGTATGLHVGVYTGRFVE